jgi:hypothetical protein
MLADRWLGTPYIGFFKFFFFLVVAMTYGKKRQRALSSADISQGRKNATLHDKLMVLDWYHANGKKNQSKTAEHFRANGFPFMKQPLLSAWVKDEQNLRMRASMSTDLSSKRIRTVRHPEFEKALTIFVQRAESRGLILLGDVIRTAGARFYDQLDIPNDERQKLSNGWLDSFKQRVGLQALRFHGEAQSANAEQVVDERKRLRTLLTGWKLRDVFNMDETALFYAMSPNKGLATTKRHGVKQSKLRLTVAFTVNAAGTERLPPLIIGHAKRPRCFQKKTGEQLGFDYWCNSRAWMTSDIFQQWLIKWDNELRRTNRKILLLVDNFAGHNYDTRIITNIRMERFSPNLTAHVQPLDSGIIQCFKAHYRRHFLERALDLFANGADDIYNINQLQAMRLICTAWEDVRNETMVHCWQHAEILPDEVTVVINSDEQAEVLSRIKECYTNINSVRPNQMHLSVEELVCPAEENDEVALESLTDDEIIDYVIKNSEMEESESVNDNEEDVQPVMSITDACTAIENLEHFIELENGKEFRHAADSLTRIKRILRERIGDGQKQTVLTNYFDVI